ncbi:MAG TPA: hypothetical protein VKB19_07100, partial [Pedobacter sp.]|nr:hypothetical protein [Pedobacter sp.]
QTPISFFLKKGPPGWASKNCNSPELSLYINIPKLFFISVDSYLYPMIRLNQDTSAEVLNEIKKGDLVTDTFSKTGLVEEIEISDDGLYKIYAYTLVTGRVITVKT